MGIGLHGGGLETIRFLLRHGATVTATDLQSPETLKIVTEEFDNTNIRFVLGKHDQSDFRNTDLVIKNPAVRRNSTLLATAPAIATDISLYLLARNALNHTGPLIAITGTKGKSTTAGACAHLLQPDFPGVRLGGNITVSPLSFVDDMAPEAPVVLELSSFQLGDLEFCRAHNTDETEWVPPLKPAVSVITNIMHDHQNYYSTMDEYVHDKTLVFHAQTPADYAIFLADEYGRSFARSTRAKVFLCADGDDGDDGDGGSVFTESGASESCDDIAALLPAALAIPGRHNRINMRMAAIAAFIVGGRPETIRCAAGNFTGIPHRMELVGTVGGITFVNDSAATIPEATLATVRALPAPVVLIAGGTDKALDIAAISDAGRAVASIHLLEGSATERMRVRLDSEDIRYSGPYTDLVSALNGAWNVARMLAAETGTATIVLSPGAASFGMFANEFDRGLQFRNACARYLGATGSSTNLSYAP